MLYCEFVKGTGCKETDYNYRVYKDLEVMYMNSNITKEQIYEYGKKLVDNSKTEKELEVERKIKDEIEMHKHEIERCKSEITWYKQSKELFFNSDVDIAHYDRMIKYNRDDIKYRRHQIAALKWVLA